MSHFESSHQDDEFSFVNKLLDELLQKNGNIHWLYISTYIGKLILFDFWKDVRHLQAIKNNTHAY